MNPSNLKDALIVPPAVSDLQAAEASQRDTFNNFVEEQDKFLSQLMTELKNDIEQGK